MDDSDRIEMQIPVPPAMNGQEEGEAGKEGKRHEPVVVIVIGMAGSVSHTQANDGYERWKRLPATLLEDRHGRRAVDASRLVR